MLEAGPRPEAKAIKDSRKHPFLRLIFLRSSVQLPVAQNYAQALSCTSGTQVIEVTPVIVRTPTVASRF